MRVKFTWERNNLYANLSYNAYVWERQQQEKFKFVDCESNGRIEQKQQLQ